MEKSIGLADANIDSGVSMLSVDDTDALRFVTGRSDRAPHYGLCAANTTSGNRSRRPLEQRHGPALELRRPLPVGNPGLNVEPTFTLSPKRQRAAA
jgi:hypothetical protein